MIGTGQSVINACRTIPGQRYLSLFVAVVCEEIPLRIEGKVVHLGRRMATAEGRLSGPDGKLYAHASTTCFIFETP